MLSYSSLKIGLVRMYVCMYVCMCVCMCVCVCMYVCVCMCAVETVVGAYDQHWSGRQRG